MYSVKEIAEKVNLSEHTVRYYTDQGLVPNVKRDQNNHRQYDDNSINWLTADKHLQQSGMSIKNLKKYVDLCLEGEETLPERFDIILEQKEHAKRQLEEAQQRMEYMERKVQHYEAILNQGLEDDTNPKNWNCQKNNVLN